MLGRFKPGERDLIDEAIHKAAMATLLWVKDGIELCMTRTNGPDESEKKEKKKKPPEANPEGGSDRPV